MEARTKIIAAVAVIMMCAAGLVGAGYAYTASTVNEGNNVSSEYITLNQAGTGAYQFANTQEVEWNTYDHKVSGTIHTLFYLSNTTPVTINTVSYDLVTVGNPITLKAAPQNGGGQIANLKCDITAVGFNYDADIAFFAKITVNGADTWLKLTANDTFNSYVTSAYTGPSQFAMAWNTTAYYDATVAFYIGYTTAAGGVDKTHVAGTHPSIPAKPVENAAVVFSLNVSDEQTPITAVDITNVSPTVQVDQELQMTYTLTPASPSNPKVIWVSSDPTVATVSATGVVTGVAAGTVNITVITLDGQFTDTIAVTVTVPSP